MHLRDDGSEHEAYRRHTRLHGSQFSLDSGPPGFPEIEQCSESDHFPVKFVLKRAHFGHRPTRGSFQQILEVQRKLEV